MKNFSSECSSSYCECRMQASFNAILQKYPQQEKLIINIVTLMRQKYENLTASWRHRDEILHDFENFFDDILDSIFEDDIAIFLEEKRDFYIQKMRENPELSGPRYWKRIIKTRVTNIFK